MHPPHNWQSTPPPAPSRGVDRGVLVAAVLAAAAILAAAGVGGWFLLREDTKPPAAPPASVVTQDQPGAATAYAYDPGTVKACSAAAQAADKDNGLVDEILDIADLVAVIDAAETSKVPALQNIALEHSARTYLDGQQAWIAVAEWCDDHDVHWPKG